MSNFVFNKKKIFSLIAGTTVVLGTVGTGLYTILSGGNKPTVEEQMVIAAKKYVEGNDIAIENKLQTNANTLVNEGYLTSDETYGGYSYVTITNENSTMTYNATVINASDDALNGAAKADIEDDELAWRIDYSTKSPTNKSVLVTISFNEPNVDIIDKVLEDGREWTVSKDSQGFTVLTKTFESNGTDRLGVMSTIGTSLSPETVEIVVSNIDKTPITVTGVENGKIYPDDVTISFNKGNGTLNGNPITNPYTVTESGTHKLVVEDEAGNKTEIEFSIYKDKPSLNTPIENNGIYNEDVTISFDDPITGTLNGKDITSPFVVTEDGEYDLIIKNPAGIEEKIHFTVDQNDPVANKFAPDNEDPTNGNVTIKLETSEAVTNLKVTPETATINKIDDKTYEIIATENGEVTVEFEDKAGNKGNASYEVINIDRTAPTARLISRNTEPTNKTITLVLQANENIEILDPNEAGFASVSGSKTKFSAKINENGIYTVTFKDAAGNIGSASIEVTNVDKDAPVVTGVENNKAYNIGSILPVITDINEVTATLNGNPYEIGTPITEEDNYTLVATDKAGNVTTVNFAIDRTAPIVTGAEDGLYYKKNIRIKFEDLTEVTATLNGEPFKTNTVVSEEGSYTLIVTDKAGNTTTVSFVMDKTAPTGVITADVTELTNGNVILTLETSEEVEITNANPAGIEPESLKGTKFTITITKNKNMIFKFKDAAGNTGSASYEVANIDKTAPIIEGVENDHAYNVDSITPTITDANEVTATLNGNPYEIGTAITEEGIYTLVATDAAGNSKTVNFAIDRTAPIVNGVTDKGAYNKDFRITFEDLTEVTATLNGEPFKNNDAVRAEGEYTLIVIDKAGNTTTVNFVMDKTAPTGTITADVTELTNGDVVLTLVTSEEVEITNVNPAGIKPETLKGNTFTITITKNKNMIFKFKDAAGNTGSASYEVTNIDKIAPTGTVTASKTDPTNGDVVLTITTSEPVTFTGDNAGNIRPVEGQENTYEITVSENDKIEFNFQDAAGNTGSTEYNVTNIDKTAPELVGEIKASETKPTNKDVTLTITTTEPVTFTGENAENIKAVEGKENTYEITVSENGNIVFNFQDAAGNTGSAEYNVTNIDKVAPTITSSTKEPDTPTNGDVVITFTVSEKVTFTGETASRVEEVTGEGVAANTYKITFEKNEEITINFQDAAGNTGSEKFVVTNIDKTNPTGTITTDSTDLTNESIKLTLTTSEDVTITTVTPEGLQIVSVGGSKQIYEITATANGTYTVNFQDAAGNTGSASYEVTNIDKTNPTGTVTASTTDPTNKDVTLTITTSEPVTFAGDNAENIKPVKDQENTYEITISENRNVVFNFQDAAGNTGSASYEVTNIDKTAPTVTSSTKEPDTPTNEDVVITFTVSEEVTFTGETASRVEKVTGEGVAENTYKITFSKNEEITVNFQDAAGNTGSEKFVVTNIDKTAPELVGNITASTTEPTNKDVVLTIKTSEPVTFTGENAGNIRPVEGKENTYEITVSENGNVVFNFQDAAGNTGNASYEVTNIDKTAPELVGNITASTTDPTNGDVTLTITTTEPVTFTGDNAGNIKPVKDQENTYEITVSENGNVVFNFQDAAGNTGSAEYNVTNIDKTGPTGTVTASTTEPTNGDVTLTITTSEPVTFTGDNAGNIRPVEGKENTYEITISENEKVEFNFQDAAGNTGRAEYNVTNIDKVAPELVGNITASTTELTNKDVTLTIKTSEPVTFTGDNAGSIKPVEGKENTYEITVSENGNVVFNFQDAAGNTGSAEYNVTNIDKSAPTVSYEITPEPNENGWYKDSVEITITATDPSDIDSYEYAIIDESTEVEEWKTATDGKFTIETDGENIKFKVRATDKAGNTSEELLSTESLNIDKTAPTVSGEIITKPNENGWYTEDITINVTANDELSGISELTYTYTTDDGQTWTNFAPVENNQFVITTDGTKVRYILRAKDKAGNTKTYNSGTVKFDKTAPELVGDITVSPTELTNGDVTLTFTTSEPVTFTGDNAESIKPVEGKENTYEITVSENGNIVFNFQDAAGNTGSAEYNVTNIDKTAPTGTVTASTTDPTNGDVTLTITTSEPVTFTGDNAGNIRPVEGKENTYEITVSENGKVVFNFQDAAENTGSASYEVTNIDKTAPELVGNITASTTELTNKDVVLTIATTEPVTFAGDNAENIKPVKDQENTYEITISENRNVVFNFQDAAGNTGSASYEVTNIDKTAPTVTSSTKEPDTPTNEDVVITFTVSEEVTFTGETASRVEKVTGEGVAENTYKITFSKNEEITVNFQDAAGNTGSEKFVVTNIDKTAPELVGNITASTTDPTNKDVTLTITTTEPVTFTGDNAENIRPVEGKGNTYEITVSENGNVVFNFQDAAGNTGNASYEVTNIDKTAPELVGNITASTTELTNKDVILTIKTSEPVTFTGDNAGNIKPVKDQENTYEITISENGNVVFNFQDAAGNTGNASYEVTNIDKAAPTGTVTASTIEPTNADVTLTITTSEPVTFTGDNAESIRPVEGKENTYEITVSENGNVVFNFQDAAGNTGSASYEVTNIDKTAPELVGNITASTTELTNKDVTLTIKTSEPVTFTGDNAGSIKSVEGKENTYEITVSENGNVVFNFQDAAGNTGSASYKVTNIDKTAPTVNYNITKAPNESGWYKDTVVVNITATDPSDIDSYEYAIIGATSEVEEWKTATNGTFTIETDGENIKFKVRATDKAGNTSEELLSTESLNIDTTLPTVKSEVVTEINESGWYIEDIVINVSGNDELSGLDSLLFSVRYNGGNWSKWAPVENGSFTITKNGDSIEYKVRAVDKAGNTKTYTDKTIFKLDTEAPIGELSDYDITPTKENITLTLTVSEPVTITNIDELKELGVEITPVEDALNTYTVVVSNNVNSTINFKDNAGKPGSVELSINNIDKTAPTGTVTASTTDPTNNDVVLTITTSEPVTFTGDNAGNIRPVEGKENTYEITVSENGNVVFNFQDAAGNTGSANYEVTNIDRVAPTGTITANPTKPTNKDVTLTLIVSEDVEITSDNKASISAVDGSKREFKMTVSENGLVVITFQDAAGNTGSAEYNVTNIDKTAPIVSGVENNKVYTTEVTPSFTEGTATLDGNNYTSGTSIAEEGKHTLIVTDEAGNKTEIEFTIDITSPIITVTNGNESHTEDFEMTVEIDKNGTFAPLEYTVTDAGTSTEDLIINVEGEVDVTTIGPYTITYTATDKGGHTTTLVVTVVVSDTSKPTVGYDILNKVDGWYKDQIQVKLKGTDEGTGISKYEYKIIVDGNEPESWEEITDLNNPIFTISNNSSNIKFKVRSVDGGNNKSPEVTSEETLQLDTERPIVSANITTPIKENGWYTENIKVQLTGSDETSGIAKLSYQVSIDNGNSWSKWTDAIFDKDSTTSATFNITTNSETILYRVKAIDNAGHDSIIISSDLIKLDTKAPVIKVQNGNKEETENFELTLEADKEGIYTIPTATAKDNLDGDINVTVNGSVDLKLVNTPQVITYTAVDTAGNERVVTLTVIVKDTKAPVITINGDKEVTVRYGSVYNDLGAVATDNLDEIVEVKMTSDLNLYKAGTYTVTYTATDNAGNTSTAIRKVIVEKTSTSELFREENGCDATGDCYNTKETDNYVWYSGHLWRVIKVNANDTVKLITEESQAGFSFNRRATSAEISSGSYVASDFEGSNAQKWLNQIFYPSLNNASELLALDNYCNEQTKKLSSARTECASDRIIKTRIGLITLDEYNILGGANSFVYTGDRFFTMTPKTDLAEFVITEKEDADALLPTIRHDFYTDEPYAIRPVITMKEVDIVSGKGTLNDPYRIKGDASGTAGSSLKDRNTGEYVSFAGRTWRIVDKQNDGTRLVYDGYYTLPNGEIDYRVYGNQTKFSTDQGIGEYLNTTVYNTLFNTDELKKAIRQNDTLYYSKISIGDSPTTTSLLSSNNRLTANVGLLRVGDLMSGGSTTSQPGKITSWTMNNNGKRVWTLTWQGTSEILDSNEAERAFRPVIKLNTNVTISGGNGTANNPYTLAY